MGHALQLFYFYGIVVQIAAIVHFVRRRPDSFWLWIILFGGALGSLVYLLVEAVPDLKLLQGGVKLFRGHGRMRELEWLITENPAPANLEELGALYMQDRRWKEARDCFTRAIGSRTDALDPYYRRAQCAAALGDHAGAIADLEHVVRSEAKFDFYRAATLLADCYAFTGDTQRAGALLEQVTRASTLTDAQLRYALFLSDQGRYAEARQWARRILEKRTGMPHFQRRAERPLFSKASALLKKLPPDKVDTGVPASHQRSS